MKISNMFHGYFKWFQMQSTFDNENYTVWPINVYKQSHGSRVQISSAHLGSNPTRCWSSTCRNQRVQTSDVLFSRHHLYLVHPLLLMNYILGLGNVSVGHVISMNKYLWDDNERFTLETVFASRNGIYQSWIV